MSNYVETEIDRFVGWGKFPETVTVRVSIDARERLRALADRDERPLQYLYRAALDEYLTRRAPEMGGVNAAVEPFAV